MDQLSRASELLACPSAHYSSPPSSSVSSPLAPSPLSLLSEVATMSPVEKRPPGSFRAHSLSYSEEAVSISPKMPRVSVVGPWADDECPVRSMRRHSGPPIARPPFGRGAPRGGRQPHRLRLLELDGMNRLPEFVNRRLYKVRSQSLGARGGWTRGAPRE